LKKPPVQFKPAAQALPQPPQLASSSASCSQPSSATGAAGVTQLAYVRAHVDVQRPALHARDMV
jgi:hypothetical protein